MAQNYEDYWRLTNAYTDYNGQKFLGTLEVCVQFIDEQSETPYSEEKYRELQDRIHQAHQINHISIRKAINQLVKLGFINSFLVSYHPQAKAYLHARTARKRKVLLSKIVYSNSSFNRAVNQESSIQQINFLIQTLIEKGSLSKTEIVALMLVDIEAHSESFISENELQTYVDEATRSGFAERKYNQIGYLYNLLKKLEDLRFVGDDLYFEEDVKRIFGQDITKTTRKRDPYLHRLYKRQLEQECTDIYGNPKCVLERLSYPVLIASHIKPFIKSNEEEAYDPENGLLLSRTIDALFDLKYISFDDDGKMLFSVRLNDDVKNFWQNYQLEASVLTDKRKSYLKYHRDLMEKKDADYLIDSL